MTTILTYLGSHFFQEKDIMKTILTYLESHFFQEKAADIVLVKSYNR